MLVLTELKKPKDIQISLSHCSCSTYNLKQSTKSHRDHCHCPAWSNASSKAPQAATSGAGPTWPDATLSGAGILWAYQVEPPKWLLESCTSGGGSRWVRDVTPCHDTHFITLHAFHSDTKSPSSACWERCPKLVSSGWTERRHSAPTNKPRLVDTMPC